jgi:hypothetical protein
MPPEVAAAAGEQRGDREHDGERLVLLARIRPECYERARELASTPPTAAGGRSVLRASTFLAPSDVVFLIEGTDVERRTTQWFDDPVMSTALSSWLPLLEGPLHAAREVARWDWRVG